MFQRKHMLIDGKLQMKSVYTVVSISAVSIIAVVFIMIMVSADNISDMKVTMEGLNGAIGVENTIINSCLEHGKTGVGPSHAIKAGIIKKDHERAVKEILDHVNNLESIIRRNYFIVGCILLLFMVQAAVLGVYFFYFTHRIAGPVYVINSYMNRIIKGEEAGFRSLRERDELRDFHDRFVEMMKKINREEQQ